MESLPLQRNGGRCAQLGAVLAGVGLLLGAGPPQIPWQGPSYVLTDLGTLGGEHSRALAMNDLGSVVGWSTTDESPHTDRHAFVWRGESMDDLGTLGGAWSEATAINNHEQIVGASVTPDGRQRAFYAYDGVMLVLDDLIEGILPEHGTGGGPSTTAVQDTMVDCTAPLDTMIEANAINDDGVIVGCGYVVADEHVHGIMLVPQWPFNRAEPSYRYVNLGRLEGALDCVALGINAAGITVGMSGGRAFAAQDGVMTPLESAAPASLANAVDCTGLAVGWAGESAMTPAACFWDGRDRYDLPAPPGWISEATAINDAGIIVGWMTEDMGHPPIATRWADGCAVMLIRETVIPMWPAPFAWDTLESATDVDHRGRIVGHGRSTDGLPRAYLLTPLVFEYPNPSPEALTEH